MRDRICGRGRNGARPPVYPWLGPAGTRDGNRLPVLARSDSLVFLAPAVPAADPHQGHVEDPVPEAPDIVGGNFSPLEKRSDPLLDRIEDALEHL